MKFYLLFGTNIDIVLVIYSSSFKFGLSRCHHQIHLFLAFVKIFKLLQNVPYIYYGLLGFHSFMTISFSNEIYKINTELITCK